MFLRCTERKKDGKVHHYYSVVENRRVAHHKVTQRTVLYLGEINQLQETAWQDLLDRFDSECQGHTVKPFRQQRLLGPQPLRDGFGRFYCCFQKERDGGVSFSRRLGL